MTDMQLKVPGGFVPAAGIMFGPVGGTAQAVDAAHPLPVSLSGATVTVAPVAPAAPVTTTIGAGEAVSPVIDLGNQRAHLVILPPAWSTAALSFQVSATGDAFVDLYDVAGEVTVPATVAAAARAVTLPPSIFHGVRYLRLRSGISGGPVIQAAARSIVLTTVAR